MKSYSIYSFVFCIIITFCLLVGCSDSEKEMNSKIEVQYTRNIESYLQKDAVINNKNIPYYGFDDPIEHYNENESVIEQYEISIKTISMSNEDMDLVYREYNNGIEIVEEGWGENILSIPKTICNKPVIKLGGFMEDPEPIIGKKSYYEFTNCFHNSTAKEIRIPATVKEIVAGTFDLDRLERIVVDKDNPYYSSKDGILYNKEGNIKLCVPNHHHSKFK